MAATTIPILPSPDFDTTAAFYEHLGFTEGSRWDHYLIMEHPAGIELHFFHSADLDEASNDHGCYVRFASDFEAQSLYDQWWAAAPDGADLREPESTDYGLLEFALLDPHRNLVRVGGVVEPQP